MQFNVENVNTVKKILHIEIPQNDVINEINKAYDNIRKNAKIKGFRPGKAPKSVIEKLYKKDVHADVSTKLIQDSLFKAIKDINLHVIGEPRVNPPVLDENSSYKYTAAVEISPKLQEIDFKGLKIRKTMYRVTDEEIEVQLKMLQKNLVTYKPIDEKRAAKEEDYVIIDYEGFKDGKPFEETQKTVNFTMKLGSNSISEVFDKEIIGMNLNESKTFIEHFPSNYKNSKLADLDISFCVLLKEIREPKFPEINDDLAKMAGKYENLDELKKTIINNLKEGYDKRIEQEQNEQIFEALLNKIEFEVPDVLINYELEGIIDDTEKMYEYYNMSMEQAGMSKDKLITQYRPVAEKMVRRFLILDKIIEQEKLILSDDELDKAYLDMSLKNNSSVEKIKDYYKQNPEKLTYLKHTLLEKNAMNIVMSNSIIEEVEPVIEKENQNNVNK